MLAQMFLKIICSCFNIVSLNKGQIVLIDKLFVSYSRFKAEDLGSSSVLRKN